MINDQYKERRFILEEIIPRIDAQASRLGVNFCCIDPRVGIRDDKARNHTTWMNNKRLIQHAFESSGGVFFITLLANNYGFRSLPKHIPQFAIQSKLESEDIFDRAGLEHFYRWYRIDSNTMPPSYALNTIHSETEAKQFYTTIVPYLREVLKRTAFEHLECSDSLLDIHSLEIGQSILDWETLYAISLDATRCHWISTRTMHEEGIRISASDGDAQLEEYLQQDEAYQQVLLTYHAQLVQHIHDSGMSCTDISHHDPTCHYAQDEAAAAYVELEAWKRSITLLLHTEIQQVSTRWQHYQTHDFGIGCTGKDIQVMLYHSQCCYKYSQLFHGRETVLQGVLDTVHQYFAETSHHNNIVLAILGAAGTGKTCLMAKVASLLPSHYPTVPVIIRFCGTSAESNDPKHLLTSLCKQIVWLYQHTDHHTTEPPLLPTLYHDLIAYFHWLLSSYPVILLLDGVDQLQEEEGYSIMTMLVGLSHCHPNTCILLSTTECSLTTHHLHTANVPWYYLAPSLAPDYYQLEEMISHLLFTRSARRLSHYQLQKVVSSLCRTTNALPTMLYLEIATILLATWTSESPEDTVYLPTDLPTLLHQVLDAMIPVHGRWLVHYTIGFLTFSQHGIRDNEMQDLLSLCDEVVYDHRQLFGQSEEVLDTVRVPMHVWLCLLHPWKVSHLMSQKHASDSVYGWQWRHQEIIRSLI